MDTGRFPEPPADFTERVVAAAQATAWSYEYHDTRSEAAEVAADAETRGLVAMRNGTPKRRTLNGVTKWEIGFRLPRLYYGEAMAIYFTPQEIKLLGLGAETLREANPDDGDAITLDAKVESALRALL